MQAEYLKRILKPIKQLFKTKVWSARWFRVASKEELESVREQLFQKLMDSNEDLDLRWRIRDKLLPYLDKVLREK